MAHLWVDDERGRQWSVAELHPAAALRIVAGNGSFVAVAEDVKNAAPGDAPWFVRVSEGADERWALVWAPGSAVTINGVERVTGFALLQDRDEVCVRGHARLYFSLERQAAVVQFPGVAGRAMCARCKQKIERDTKAVRCPQCGTWYHASEELPCWTYAETCALCDQPTALDHGYRWTPAAAEEAPAHVE